MICRRGRRPARAARGPRAGRPPRLANPVRPVPVRARAARGPRRGRARGPPGARGGTCHPVGRGGSAGRAAGAVDRRGRAGGGREPEEAPARGALPEELAGRAVCGSPARCALALPMLECWHLFLTCQELLDFHTGSGTRQSGPAVQSACSASLIISVCGCQGQASLQMVLTHRQRTPEPSSFMVLLWPVPDQAPGARPTARRAT